MIALIVIVATVAVGILYNLVFCLVFEKLDAKKFQRERATQLNVCAGGGVMTVRS